MLSHFGSLLADPRANQAAILSSASLLAFPVGFATSAVLARLLGPEDYGVYFFFFAIVAFTAAFFQFGFFNTSGFLVAECSEPDEQRDIIGATCVAYSVIGGAFSVVVFGLGFVVDGAFDSAINAFLRVYSPLAIAMPLEHLIPFLARGTGSMRMLAFYRLFPKLLFLVALLVAAAGDRVSISLVIAFHLLSVLVSSFAVLWFLKPSLRRLRENLRRLAETTRSYGFPLYLGQMFDGAVNNLDKLMISYFFGTRELGFYALAYLMASAIVVVPTSLCTTVFRDLVRSERLPPRVLWVSSALTVAAFLGFLALVYPAVLLVLGEDFLPVVRLCWPLAAAGLIQGLHQPYTMFLEGKGKGLWLRDNFLYQGNVRMALDFALIPFFGPFGAAVAVAVSRLVHLLRYSTQMRRFESERAAGASEGGAAA